MMNAVLRREAKTSLRNWKVYGVLLAHVLIITLGAVLFTSISIFSSYEATFDPIYGLYLYIFISAFQMALILLTVPALAAGSISGERERQTLDLLLITHMKPVSIIVGKLFSSIGLILLMTVATLPAFAIVFFFGGISMFSFVKMIIFMIVTACMAGSISIFMSTIFKKSTVATVMVYLIIGVLTIGTLVAVLLYIAWIYNNFYRLGGNGNLVIGGFSKAVINVLMSANPGVAFFSMVENQLGVSIISDIVNIGGWTVSKNLWIHNMVFNLVITVVFVLASARAINSVRRK